MKKRSVKSLIVAAGVVSMLTAGYGFAASNQVADGDAKVKCTGINSCEGHGECGAADGSHDCAGKNSCKGKGWVKVSKEECEEKGGEVMGEKKDS